MCCPFPSSARSMGEVFSSILCRELGKTYKEVKFAKVLEALLRMGPFEFLTLSVIHSKPLAICQLQFRFSYHTGSNGGSCEGRFCISVFTCLFLQFTWQWFTLWTHLSETSRKRWFLSLSYFSLWLRQSYNFQSPHVLEPKPKVKHVFLNNVWK